MSKKYISEEAGYEELPGCHAVKITPPQRGLVGEAAGKLWLLAMPVAVGFFVSDIAVGVALQGFLALYFVLLGIWLVVAFTLFTAWLAFRGAFEDWEL